MSSVASSRPDGSAVSRLPAEMTGNRSYVVRMVGLSIVAFLVVAMVACGSGSSGLISNPVMVTVTPNTNPLNAQAGQTIQFTANVTNTTNTAVTWQVNQVTGGDATHGMITTGGLYTAPSTIPNPATVTVTAISQADTTASQSVTVTVIPCTTICVSPSAASVAAGAMQTFTATNGGVPDTNVTWQVNGVTGGDATHGTISATGVYTAPATPPAGQSVTIGAVDNGGAGTGTATATIVFSNATLHGPYAFSFSGTTNNGFIGVAGSFTADGKGNITSGLQDINSGSGVFTSKTFTGTYAMGSDGRGDVALTWQTPSQKITWKIAMASDQHGLLIRFDGVSSTNAGAGSGSIDRQDTTAFNTGALSGNYVINVSGADSASNPIFEAGALTASAASITGDGTPNVVLDVNDDGAVQSSTTLSGNYMIQSTGRGTLALTSATTLATQNFAVYVVNANLMNLVEVDSGAAPAVLGSVNRAAASPALNGSYAFTMGGVDNVNAPFALGGVLTGGLTGGTIDNNDNGSFGSLSVTGCTCAVTGARGQASLQLSNGGTIGLAGYPAADGSVALIGIDGTFAAGGVAFQQAASVDQSSATGSFALNWNGAFFDPLTGAPEEEDISGQLAADSTGAVSGNLDLSVFGVITNPNAATTGTVSVSSNGRGILNAQAGGVTPASFSHNIYVVDNNTTLVLDTDGTRVLLGVMKRQY